VESGKDKAKGKGEMTKDERGETTAKDAKIAKAEPTFTTKTQRHQGSEFGSLNHWGLFVNWALGFRIWSSGLPAFIAVPRHRSLVHFPFPLSPSSLCSNLLSRFLGGWRLRRWQRTLRETVDMRRLSGSLEHVTAQGVGVCAIR
jgi:hypothetical protein